MRNIVIIIISCQIFLFSCAKSYTGRIPKLDDKSINKEEEYNRFRFKEGYWNQYKGAFTMGQDEKLYTMKSLEPVIDEVDSKGFKENIKISDKIGLVSISLIGVALAILALDTDVENWSSSKKTTYYSLLGLSLAGSYVSFHFINNATKNYNQDLKKRLSPGLKASYSY